MTISIDRIRVIKWAVFLLAFVCTEVKVTAQDHRKEGDQAWEEGRYKTAVNKYGKVKSLQADKKLLAKRGFGFYKLNRLPEAIDHFTLSKKLGNDDPDLYLLMAQTKQHLDQYDEAAFFYKEYIRERGHSGPQSQLALREMKNCLYSAMNQIKDASGVMNNLGPEVNTYYDEIYPVQSPRFGNVYYFTSNRNLKDMEVFSYAIGEKGVWKQNEGFGEGINSTDDQYVMDVSADGQCLLFVTGKAKNVSKRIYVSTFDDQEQQHFVKLPDYIVDGAADVQIIDRNSIAFASNQLGGLGGYDIFTINYQNGVWSDPINAGDKINTSYNERSPYFASTGEYLYFSSDKPYCYGGYDVYYYNILSIDTEPDNMGKPINSSGNDLMFRLHEDGQTALMSSDRKTGEGAYDIYQVFMTLPKPMPPRSKDQLTYVRDYFNRLKPQAQITEEDKRTHLEELKDRMALEEKEKETETESEAEEQEEVADATEMLEKVEKDQGEEMEMKEQESVTMEEKSEKMDPEVEQKEGKKTAIATEEKTKKIGLEMEVPAEKEVEDPMKENKPAVEVADKDSDGNKMEEGSMEEAIKRLIEEKEALLAEQEDQADSKKEAEDKAVSVKKTVDKEVVVEETKPAKTNRPNATNTASNLPQPASDESPLGSIRTKSDALEKGRMVKVIDGNKVSNALLYQDRQDLMNDINKAKVENLRTYLKDNPQHKVHIISHTDHLEPGLPEFMQYNTLKRANLIARYLMENGVARDNISIESVSANYPLAKPNVSGQLNKEYLAYNKRIEFELLDESNTILASHNISDVKIPGFALDRKYELYSLIREEVYYSVEIANSEHIFKNAVLRLYDDIYIRKETPIANNRYYIGIFNKYEEVLALQQELAESSAPYAKIRVFYQGQPVAKSDLKLLARDYPDLEAYLAGQE